MATSREKKTDDAAEDVQKLDDFDENEDEEDGMAGFIHFFESVERNGAEAREENEEYLRQYSEHLHAQDDLKETQILEKMNDLNHFLNTFLSGYGHRFDVGVEQVNYFLGEWFLKDNRGVTAKDICDIAAHLVEFYECMEKNGNVDHAYVKEFKENAYSDVWRWASYAEQCAEGEFPFWF